MELNIAVQGLNALAQESRLKVFRLLIQHGETGLPAGQIARDLAIPHNTLSSHLNILHNAGLVASRRESRSIIYRIDFDGTRALMAFLMADCCLASPDSLQPLLDSLQSTCCAPPESGDKHETLTR